MLARNFQLKSEAEAEVLRDIIDWWLEEFAEATDEVIKDPIHTTPEDLLYSVDGMHMQFRLLSRIRGDLAYGAASPTG